MTNNICKKDIVQCRNIIKRYGKWSAKNTSKHTKNYNYCFAREVGIIKGHTFLISIFKEDITMLLQTLHYVLLKVQWNRFNLINKSGPDVYIADWLLRQDHGEDKGEETVGLQVNIKAMDIATDIPTCMTIWKDTTLKDKYLQQLGISIISGWPTNRGDVS